jgi:hypothetical protein
MPFEETGNHIDPADPADPAKHRTKGPAGPPGMDSFAAANWADLASDLSRRRLLRQQSQESAMISTVPEVAPVMDHEAVTGFWFPEREVCLYEPENFRVAEQKPPSRKGCFTFSKYFTQSRWMAAILWTLPLAHRDEGEQAEMQECRCVETSVRMLIAHARI